MASALSAISSASSIMFSLGLSVITFLTWFGTSSFIMSFVLTSAKLLYKVKSSGKFVNLANLVFALYPCPLGDISRDVIVSPKSAAHPSKYVIPSSCKVRGWRYVCIVYISVIELDIGVPVAKTIPLSPLCSSLIYSHFNCKSVALPLAAVEIPDTLFILVYKNKFL